MSGLDDWKGKVAVACAELQHVKELWVFGYGSLLWKPGFKYEEKKACYVKGFIRRFWQASTDHRGKPEFPGRVVTLVRDEKGLVWGNAYRVAEENREAVIEYLDEREKGGYSQSVHPAYGRDGSKAFDVLFYIGTEDNKAFINGEKIEDTAKIIAKAVGPSGKNVDYLGMLHKALRDAKVEDPHVEQLVSLVELEQGGLQIVQDNTNNNNNKNNKNMDNET